MTKSDMGFLAIIGMWAVYVLLCFAIFGGVIWAAIHFIRKFW